MNISKAFNQAFSKRMSVADLDHVMDMMMGGGGPQTWSGNHVSENSALKNPTVFSCVRVISEAFASMPCHMYRRMSDGDKQLARQHYLYPVLHDKANPYLPAFNFREIGQSHLCTWGNHYSLIEWDNADRVKALYPLPPDRVKVTRESVTGPRQYQYRQNNGAWLPVGAEYMFHVSGLGYDGIAGYSPIGLMRQAIGAADAVNEFGARLFGNGVRNSGFLEHPGALQPAQAERLSKSFREQYTGLSNAHRVILLEGGLKFTPSSMPPDDAQFLETKKFSRAEICGIFRVPPHLIADLERSTNNNIEHQSLEFVTFTLVPWMTRWESAIETQLLSDTGRAGYFVEIDANGLMRGDAASRAAFYKSAINDGWMTPNEARVKENMNTEAAGDVFMRPLNTSYVGKDGQPVLITEKPKATEAVKA